MPTQSRTNAAPTPPLSSRICFAASGPLCDDVVGPVLAGQLESGLGGVDGDDASAGQQAKELHRVDAQPTDPDHDRRAAGPDPRQGRLDHAVRRDARIRQRRGLDRVEVADGNEESRLGNQDVGRMSSVVADARSANALLVEAVVLFSRPAHVTAAAARPRGVDRHGVTRLEPRYACPHLFDPAGDLVPEGEGRLLVAPVIAVARDDGEVGVAEPRACDFDDDLARSRVRLGHVLKFRLGLRLQQSVREHRSILSQRPTAILREAADGWHHHPARGAGFRVRSTRLTTTSHARETRGETPADEGRALVDALTVRSLNGDGLLLGITHGRRFTR